MKKTSLLLIILTCIALKAHSQDMSDSNCIKSKNAAVKNIRLFDTKQHVFKILGEPLKITHDKGEDDGGEYDLLKFKYKDLTVEMNRNEVSLIKPLNKNIASGYGIKVGALLSDIEKNIGYKMMTPGYESNPAFISLCHNDNAVIKLYYNDSNIVTKYILEYESP